MPLSQDLRKAFRKKAHHLRPVVITGAAGLTKAVMAEIDSALAHHELIKIRFGAGDREYRKAMIADCCKQLCADLVQQIGATATIYRKQPED